MKQGALGLTDEQFWEDSTPFEEAIVERFLADDYKGLVIDGPRSVGLDEHDTIPLLGVRASTIREDFALGLQRRAVIVATRLEGHETLAATAFRQPDERRPPARPRDPATLPEGRTADAFSISLTARLPGLPWRPGTWQITLLLYDGRSNAVVTRLEGSTSQDPEVQAFLAAQRRPGFPPPIAPSFDLTSPVNPYRPRPDSPAPPADPAISLAVDRVVIAGSGRSCVLRGSFCLPVLSRDVVRPLPGPPGSEAEQRALADGWVEVGDPAAVAVVPITILLTGDQRAEPILISMQVPVYGPLDGPLDMQPDGQVARGHFAVNLFGNVPGALAIQSYAVWAISRGIISDPVRVGVVSEKMLPAVGD
jgi:hypothetical protein